MNEIDPQLQTSVEDETLDTQGFESPRSLMDVLPEDLVPLLDLAQRVTVKQPRFLARKRAAARGLT